jgi:FdhD protein
MAAGAAGGPGGPLEQAARMYAAVVRDGEPDRVAVEEPLEIRVNGKPLAVTMRTPGHDDELAAGFLWGEGLLAGPPSVELPEDLAANTVDVLGELTRDPGERNFYISSSCGVCGKGALEEVERLAPALPPGPVVPRDVLSRLPDLLRQPAFEVTGGLHATGLFDPAGELLVAREDVGRHNAMDKVVGRCLLDGGLPLSGLILCVSGRLAFELVQKAVLAGCPVLVGVGAPTSLAVSLAEDRGLTLCGFARDGRVNVYAGAGRVDGEAR